MRKVNSTLNYTKTSCIDIFITDIYKVKRPLDVASIKILCLFRQNIKLCLHRENLQEFV